MRVSLLLAAWAIALAAQTSGSLPGTGCSKAAPVPSSPIVGSYELQWGVAVLIRLRGGGRRRKDWQSPRPGDSDEIYSQSASDPSWSVAEDDEDDDDPDARRQIFDGSDEVSDSGSYSEQPRQHRHHGRARHAARPARRPLAQARLQHGPAKSRSRVRHAGRSRREPSSGDDMHSHVDSDDYAPAPRSRRAATEGPDPGLRWGTAATDALDAVLRGKLGIGTNRRRNMDGGSRKTASGRTRSLYQEQSDDSSQLSVPDPTSSSSKQPRTNARRVGRPRKDDARGGQLDQGDSSLHLEADSWVGAPAPRALTHTHTASASPLQALPSYASNPSSSISDALPSHKRSSSLDKQTPPRATSGCTSPQVLAPSPQESRARSIFLSPVCLAEQAQHSASSLAPLSDGDSESMPADDGDDGGAECVTGAAVEEVLNGLARRLECEGDAVFLTQTSSRAWRGVAVTARSADAAAGGDAAKSTSPNYGDSSSSLSLQSPRYSYDSSPGEGSRAHAHVVHIKNIHTLANCKGPREASTFVAPVR